MDALIARRYQVLPLLACGIAILLFQSRIGTMDKAIEQDTVLPRNVIGIELGRTYSRTAIPSYVAFLEHPDRPPLVGFEAKEQASENLKNTIYDFKLLLGQNSSSTRLHNTIKDLKYDVTIDANKRPFIKISQYGNQTLYTPEEIQALVIKKLKSMAESHLNTTITHATIAIPSHFNDAQRQAINNSASLAGITVLRFANETSSIGFAYEVDIRPCDQDFGRYECRYLVYAGDEGGETELAALWSDEGLLEILGTVNSRGEDNTRHGFGETLADPPDEQPTPPDFVNGIEKSQKPRSKNLQDLLVRHLADSNISKEAIDGIIINTSAQPGLPQHVLAHVKTILQSYFPNTEILAPPEHMNFKYDEAIVCGAAKQGYWLSDEYPWTGPQIAILNVLGLGIELSSGAFLRIIHRDENIPFKAWRVISASSPNQNKVTIRVFEGEREIASENKFLGAIDFDLDEKSAYEEAEARN